YVFLVHRLKVFNTVLDLRLLMITRLHIRIDDRFRRLVAIRMGDERVAELLEVGEKLDELFVRKLCVIRLRAVIVIFTECRSVDLDRTVIEELRAAERGESVA